jgi:hypothetical protein
MKALREIYDFVTGGSIVAPIGVAVTIAATLATQTAPPSARAAILLGLTVCTFAASTLERE